jgi:hypothetical protein
MKTLTITTILAGAMLLSSCGNSGNRYQMQVHGEHSKVYILDGENGTLYESGNLSKSGGSYIYNMGSIEDVPEAGDIKEYTIKED